MKWISSDKTEMVDLDEVIHWQRLSALPFDKGDSPTSYIILQMRHGPICKIYKDVENLHVILLNIITTSPKQLL